MFLPINSQVSVRDLLRGAIIVSANDACVVLAEGSDLHGRIDVVD